MQELSSSVYEFEMWLDSAVGTAIRGTPYLLVGEAGSGKTHLLLESTKHALAAKRPAVFLAGAQLGRGNLWASIADQLGLGSVGADVLLAAMDSAGEASSLEGRRFVIALDALNETPSHDFWQTHLPALRGAVAPYPHIALVVSCRNTYESIVIDTAESRHYQRSVHPGFATREIEATHRYFSHYGLEAPRIPLLTPEFTLPLFLRLFCESISQASESVDLEGHHGRVATFERFLAVKVARTARRLRPDATSAYELDTAQSAIRRALNEILDCMSEQGREGIGAPDALAIATDATSGTGYDPVRVLGLLQEEGVLARDLMYLDGSVTDAVRVTFQAFADFLLLRRKTEKTSDPLTDINFKHWLAAECSFGIIEAASTYFPEAFGIELADLVDIQQQGGAEEVGDWQAQQRARQFRRSLILTLPYRASSAVTRRTIELLNDSQAYVQRSEFYNTLFTIAPQSGNRLNGEGLHRYLLRRRMPQRDRDFGFSTYSAIWETYGPISRLAQWAAGGPYPDYNAETIELSCTALCWLLSSPNRYMRDWVTKGLVQVLHGHLDVMEKLCERFWVVDDPYVVQRVFAIAYGAVLRSSHGQREQARSLAEAVHRLVFTRPMRPDELLLDSARGIVRWAVANRLLDEEASIAAQRPYGLKLPGAAPTEATLDAKYPWRRDEVDDASYSSLRLSLLSMGDFGRYVVEAGVHHFSRHRIGAVYPESERKDHVLKGKWTIFVRSLSSSQRAQLAESLDPARPEDLNHFAFVLRGEEDPLTTDQRTLLAAAVRTVKPQSDEYPGAAARRWIFRRVISLGWTPELFGDEDRRRGHGRGREGHKAERWGKKYQWIAYHELLARIADNFQPARTFGETGPFQGLHEIIGDREIDPSLPPISFRSFADEDASSGQSWQPAAPGTPTWPSRKLNFKRYRGEISAFLSDRESEPTLHSSLMLTDAEGDTWVVLEGSAKQTDPQGGQGWRGPQQAEYISTALIQLPEAQSFVAALAGKNSFESFGLIESHGHIDCCFVGEVGRAAPDCYHRHDDFEDTEIAGRNFKLASLIEEYSWEGNILDCSIEESARLTLPSAYAQSIARLSFDERGPSWVDERGNAVFVYTSSSGGDALIARASYLQELLSQRQLALVVTHRWERMELSGRHDELSPSVEQRLAAFVTADLLLHEAVPLRTEHDFETTVD